MLHLVERRQHLKRNLRTRQKVFSGWISFYHPSIAEIFSKSTMDFVGIDAEHSTISLEQSMQIIAACQGNGSLCLPRIGSLDVEIVKRFLDSGADGLIIPSVASREEIEQVVSWSKYSPVGNRSFGVARAQGYGFNFSDYVEQWNETSVLIAQIETIKGVENLEKILSCEQVDAVMIGPYDLSGSLGIPGELDHPKVKEAERYIIEICKKFERGCGIQVVESTSNTVQEAFSKGFTFVVLSSDLFLLWKWSENTKKMIHSLRH